MCVMHASWPCVAWRTACGALRIASRFFRAHIWFMARLAFALVLTVLCGCTSRVTPHTVHVRNPGAETRRVPRPRVPRLIAPPPAYGNRIVMADEVPPNRTAL